MCVGWSMTIVATGNGVVNGSRVHINGGNFVPFTTLLPVVLNIGTTEPPARSFPASVHNPPLSVYVRTSMFNSIKTKLLFLVVSLLATSAAAAQDERKGIYQDRMVNAPSFSEQQKDYFNFAKHTGREERAEALETEPGTGKTAQYDSTRHFGKIETPESRKIFPIRENTPQTNAKKPLSDQPVPHPFIQKLFTEYSNPMLNHFGPPRHPLPFRVTPDHNPYPRDLNPAAFADRPYMTGAPPSDLVDHASTLAGAHRTAEGLLSPSYQTAQAKLQAKLQTIAEGTGDAAAQCFECALSTCSDVLINVANESASQPPSQGGEKTLPQVAWIVQKLYKNVYLPMALLFLLPGALLTQIKSFVAIYYKSEQDEDLNNPLTGILRGAVAITLIPAVQLAVSYSIDVGNSMTHEVEKMLHAQEVISWGQKQTTDSYNGNSAQRAEKLQSQSTSEALRETLFNGLDFLLDHAFVVLLAFQTVLVCYLFLLGPIAAAFLAWPGNIGKLFAPIFGNWMNALLLLTLWRFWWCAIVLCMATRLSWMSQSGQSGGEWEDLIYTAFLVMLVYVPFAPFDFRPGDMVDQLLQKARVK